MTNQPANNKFITKWGYRLVLFWFAYAVCQWLDKIKVRRVTNDQNDPQLAFLGQVVCA